jgi:hypothetical protein
MDAAELKIREARSEADEDAVVGSPAVARTL